MENEALASDPLIGKIISERYRVLERIGRGGFGAVYKVQHIRLDKTLALKVLFEHTHQNPRMIKRFEREARATCRIGHDNIVEITDFARDRRVGYYFVMEHLVGETLAERLRKLGPMPGARIIHIACQIADALAATHAKGIVHRDLKPDNIFLVRKRNEESFVKILDFGIAAMGDLEDQMPRLTRHGAMLGTPAYMSPEQAEGKPPDHRSDIYSLGIILYEMATGQVPYRNAASMAVLEMHRSTDPVPPRQARPDLNIPPSLERVTLRSLRKLVSQRYQSMREIYNDLVNVSQQIDMSDVIGLGRRPEVRVDGPPTPMPDDVEQEEPEWLDEDLVLLDEPAETLQLTAAQLQGAPTMVDRDPPTDPVMVEEEAIFEDVTGEENTEATFEAIVVPEATMPMEQPRWSKAPGDRAAKTTRTQAPKPASTDRIHKAHPAAKKKSSAKRGKKKPTIWQRPAFLMAAGFAVTFALYGAFLALQSPDRAPTAPNTEATPTKRAPEAVPAPEPASQTDAEDERVAETATEPEPKAGTAKPTEAGEPAPAIAPAEAPAAAKPVPAVAIERRTPAPETERRPAGPVTEAPFIVVARVAEQLERRARVGVEIQFSTVELELMSNPEGAAVYRGKEKLGVTPFKVLLPRQDEKIKLTFKLKGYASKPRKVALNGDKAVVVKLRKPRAGGGRGGRGSSGNTYEIY